MNFTRILTIDKSPIRIAFVTVISTLLGIETKLIESKDIQKLPREFQKSLMILSESQISYLAALRLHNFTGPIIVLSPLDPGDIKKKYPIFSYGPSSYYICQPSIPLSVLLLALGQLMPMQPGMLDMLKKQLEVPVELLDREVIPHLEKLKEKTSNRMQELEAIELKFNNLLRLTPATRHEKFNPEDTNSPQLQQIFPIFIDNLRNSQDKDLENISLLQQVFERWRKSVVRLGEGLGEFSEKD